MTITHRLTRKSIRFVAGAVPVLALTMIAAAAPTIRGGPSDSSTSRIIYGLSAFESCALDLFEEGASSPDDPQKSERFPASLGFTTSAIWRGEKLLLADTTHNRVVTAEMTGRVDAVDFAATAEKRRQGPSFIWPRPYGGFAVGYFLKEPGQMSAYQRVFFAGAGGKADADARFEGFLQPKGRRYFDPSRLQNMVSTGFFQGVPTNKGLFMVGGARTLAKGAEMPDSGSHYVPLIAYVDHEQFLAYKNPMPDDELYRLTSKTFARDLPLMTVIEEKGESVAYILFLEEEPKTPWIGRARTTSTEIERLPYFPKTWSRVPQTDIKDPARTPINEAVADIEQFYRGIERSERPIGIYSWRSRLFILAKGKANPTNGHTAWQLVEVSKESGKTLRKIHLPSESEHILLVPAIDQVGLFAILEKGAIDIIDNLRIHYLYRPGNKVVLFPETRLDVREPAGFLHTKSNSSCAALWAGSESPG